MKKENIKRKGQMEIMGLVIIIVLLSLGMLFVVKFTILDEKESIKKPFKSKQEIANFVNAFRLTTIEECNYASIEHLLVDCADRILSINCDSSINNCKSSDNCASDTDNFECFIHDKFLADTLDTWKVNYRLRFFLDDGGDDIIKLARADVPECSNENVGGSEAKPYTKLESDVKPIPLGPGPNIFVEINVCSE
ncbi:MAG: hypothetical protein ABII01_06505 [Candidatus Woesearchaeota archaeon]